jgi:hypothetical protein
VPINVPDAVFGFCLRVWRNARAKMYQFERWYMKWKRMVGNGAEYNGIE